MTLENETIAILVGHEFEDIEMEYCVLNLSHKGAEVQLVPVNVGFNAHEGSDEEPVRGRFGTPAPPIVMGEGVHYTVVGFEDLNPAELDCVLYPGGFSPDHLRTVPEIVKFTEKAYESGTLVAAICHGPWMLAEADIIDGTEVCAWQAVHTDLENAGATVQDVGAIQDGNIVTGRCPDDLPVFCDRVAEALAAGEVPQAADD